MAYRCEKTSASVRATRLISMFYTLDIQHSDTVLMLLNIYFCSYSKQPALRYSRIWSSFPPHVGKGYRWHSYKATGHMKSNPRRQRESKERNLVSTWMSKKQGFNVRFSNWSKELFCCCLCWRLTWLIYRDYSPVTCNFIQYFVKRNLNAGSLLSSISSWK